MDKPPDYGSGFRGSNPLGGTLYTGFKFTFNIRITISAFTITSKNFLKLKSCDLILSEKFPFQYLRNKILRLNLKIYRQYQIYYFLG